MFLHRFRPFLIQPVTGSNLVFLVINMICPEKKFDEIYSDGTFEEIEEPKSPSPVEIYYNMSLSCYKVLNNDFPRRQYMSCINRSIHVSLNYIYFSLKKKKEYYFDIIESTDAKIRCRNMKSDYAGAVQRLLVPYCQYLWLY